MSTIEASIKGHPLLTYYMKGSASTTLIGTSHIVLSRDGTKIAYLSVGGGPSVLVIPGVLSMAADYAAFARPVRAFYGPHHRARRTRRERPAG
jgi:hypothetical protein